MLSFDVYNQPLTKYNLQLILTYNKRERSFFKQKSNLNILYPIPSYYFLTTILQLILPYVWINSILNIK